MSHLPEKIPHHVAIIMDGNGRWAKERGKPRQEGHRAGTDNLRRILKASVEYGIKILTVYAFSTENWGRPTAEVNFLMRLIPTMLDRELEELHASGVQLRHIGHPEGLPARSRRRIAEAIEKTRYNDRLILNVAFNYGGRDELIDAIRRIIADGIPPEEVDETLINYYLFTCGQADPDLIIRTSGEFRVSNFLIWQGSYAEYFVTPKYWPDFDADELRNAIWAFAKRERRFGLVEPPD